MNNEYVKVHNERNAILLPAWMQRKQQQYENTFLLISKQFYRVSVMNCVKGKRSVLRGWNFITRHWSIKWCQRSVETCFAVRVLQPLSLREMNVRCVVKSRQFKTFTLYMSCVSNCCAIVTVYDPPHLEVIETQGVNQNEQRTAVIFTDSKITLDSIRSTKNHNHLAEEIRKRAVSLTKKLENRF